jgi:SAM-dependent methyltransferase
VSDRGPIVTGGEYVRAITAAASDRRYRREFQRLALKLTRSGDALFDFGSGPGIDARFYAEHDRRVCAYDVDPRMCEYLASECRAHILAGTVVSNSGSYSEFLASASLCAVGQVELVTANFAPLNLIDDLPGLFAKFGALTGPTGAVLASLLNPYFVGDLRYPWWWRNLGRLLRQGRYAVPGAQALIWRRQLADYSRACAPDFRLASVFLGDHARMLSSAPWSWVQLSTCRFLFLLFRKGPAGLPLSLCRAA